MNYEALKEAEKLVTQAPGIPEDTKLLIKQKIEEARTPLQTDTWIYRLVVSALGLAILTCVTFSFILTLSYTGSSGQGDLKIPEIFMAIGSAAVGALAGLLAPSPAANRSQS